jgi:hypothetical protein
MCCDWFKIVGARHNAELLEVDTDFSALEGLGCNSLWLGYKVFLPLLLECHAFYFMKLEGSCSGAHKPQVNKFCTVIFSVIFEELSLHSSHVKMCISSH